MTKRSGRVWAAFVLSIASGSFLEAKVSTPAEKCAATRLNAASKKLAGKLRCCQKAVTANGRLHPNCLVVVEATFAAAFARAEARGGCATTGDAAAFEMQVDADVAALVGALAPVTITTTPTTTASTANDHLDDNHDVDHDEHDDHSDGVHPVCL